jgi:hypothetical protein
MPVKYKPWALKNENGDLWGVKLLESDFAGTIISIASFSMEDSNDGSVALDFTIIEKPPTKDENDMKSDKFNSILADVVNDMIEKAIDDYENRDSDSPESSK